MTRTFLSRISHDTFLRLIRTTAIELPQTTVIGLDDFAFRKGHDYGTLICDLETHQPLAILPGRTSEIVEAWLQNHPHIQTISRDGSKMYREAITNANPTITQVSDRWHLIKNAKEALVKWLEQKLPAQIEWPIVQNEEVIHLPEDKPIDEQQWQLIQHVQQDYKEGLRITHIAQKHHLSRGTIYNYLKQIAPPPRKKRKIKPAQLKLQPYYETILAYDTERLTMDQIFQKIRLAGYGGSQSALRRFLEPYRANKKKQLTQTLVYIISRTQLTQWIWKGFDTLEDEKKQKVAQCRSLYPFIETIEKMVQEYRILFKNRHVDSLIVWMNTQLANKNSPFYSYCLGLRLDLAAVKNAFTALFKWFIRRSSEPVKVDQTNDVWSRKD